MELKFIGQGLDSENDIAAGDYLIDSLNDERYTSFKAFVAFISKSGIDNILDELTTFIGNGGSVCLYVGVDLNSTSKEALEKLIELGIETYIIFSPNSIIYHPKIYTFEGDEYSKAIIGSSNFTKRGLFQSIEASVSISFNIEDDEIGNNFLAEVYEYYNTILNDENPSCNKLTPELLKILVESKVVLPEAVNWKKQNKVNKEFGSKDSSAYDSLLKKFGKLKAKRPPKGHKKVVTKEEIIFNEDKEESITSEIIELETGSMWIETGRLTGGSKNQLDLSKQGKLDDVLIQGSVTFFGLEPDDFEKVININLKLGGKLYKTNPIDYREDNQNWRLLLKGVTDEGDKLTSISRMQLGQDGGFVKKILLFTKMEGDNYKLEILDLNDKDSLIENSTVWGKMGRNKTGRAYGFI
ncbi:phospholipase D-like domain-containing protein [Polaribacter uvawellassae]|uniref:phospholipase D-like domain-containing protein n=1 Tax=Polaribacter uvawellassae TaxID=3133495 RepID=UPI00321A370D